MSPVFLEAPRYEAGGPDGKGWNRLSLNAHMGQPSNRCALLPRSYAALVESRDTRRARWDGTFGPCVSAGSCATCAVFTAPSATIPWDGEDGRVLVRLQPSQGSADRLFVMQDAAAGWDSRSVRLSWTEVSRLDGWDIGRAHADEFGDGFWLVRVLGGAS